MAQGRSNAVSKRSPPNGGEFRSGKYTPVSGPVTPASGGLTALPRGSYAGQAVVPYQLPSRRKCLQAGPQTGTAWLHGLSPI